MAVTDQLRQAVIESGDTHYRIWKETGVDVRALDRFVNGETSGMRGHNIDRLCDYLGLELRPVKKPSTAWKHRPARGRSSSTKKQKG